MLIENDDLICLATRLFMLYSENFLYSTKTKFVNAKHSSLQQIDLESATQVGRYLSYLGMQLCTYLGIFVPMYVPLHLSYLCRYFCTYVGTVLSVQVPLYLCRYLRIYVSTFASFVSIQVPLHFCRYLCTYVGNFVPMQVTLYLCSYLCLRQSPVLFAFSLSLFIKRSSLLSWRSTPWY